MEGRASQASFTGDAGGAALPSFAAPYIRHFADIFDRVTLFDDFALIPIEVRSRVLVRAFATWIREQGRAVTVMEPEGERFRVLAASLLEVEVAPKGLVIVSAPDEAGADVREGLSLVNLHRDAIVKHLRCPLLYCGPRSFMEQTLDVAPDFWSIREIPEVIEIVPESGVGPVGTAAGEEKAEPPEEIEPLLDAAIAQGDSPNAARMGLRLARGWVEKGSLDEAERVAKEALTRFQAMNERGQRGVAACEEVLGDIARERDLAAEARGHYQRALDLAERLDDDALTARLYHRLGMTAQMERDLDAAEGWYKKSLGLLGSMGDQHAAARAHDGLSRVAREIGKLDVAEREALAARAIFEKLGDEHSAAITSLRLGQIAEKRLDFDAADERYEEARKVIEKLRDDRSAVEAYQGLGRVAAARGDHREAERWLLKALDGMGKGEKVDNAKAEVYGRLADNANARRDKKAEKRYRKERLAALGKDPWPVEMLTRTILFIIGSGVACLFFLGLFGVLKACESVSDKLKGEDPSSACQSRWERCEEACDQGNDVACNMAGNLFKHGSGGRSKDLARAAAFYQKERAIEDEKCTKGDGYSCHSLGIKYEHGENVSVDQATAMTYFQKGCDAGRYTTCYRLAEKHIVNNERARGVDLHRRLCRVPFVESCVALDKLGEKR